MDLDGVVTENSRPETATLPAENAVYENFPRT